MRDVRSFDRDRSRSALVLGFRMLALATVAGGAALAPSAVVNRSLVIAGILAALVVSLLQHATLRRVPPGGFVPAHAAVWTLLLHATGGPSSPLVLGYLLELPLSGALLSRAGVAGAALACVASYLAYAFTIGSPFQPRSAVVVVTLIMVCALISWRVVMMLERQQRTTEDSHEALASRAEALATELIRLADSLGDSLVTIDGCGRISRLNPSAAELLGIVSESAQGRPWQEVLAPDQASRARVCEVLDSGAAQYGVTMVLSPRLVATITARADIWIGSDDGGRGLRLLLDPRPESVPDDPMRRLGESAACVAHQIKNSMQALQGLIRGVGARAAADDEFDTTEKCLTALRSLGALAEDVLAMAGASPTRCERVVIQEILRSAVILLDQPRILMTAPQPPLYVEARRGALMHAMFNLLDNAARSNRAGATVSVSVENRGPWVVVDITDAGPGIPPDVARARGPLRSRRGSGLGLMAARRFVEDCGGRLSLTALDARGTRCRVELPRIRSTLGLEGAGAR